MVSKRKHIGGIKAKYVKISNPQNPSGHENHAPAILIISPEYRRITFLLNRILKKAGKQLECHGVELYRQALVRQQTDLANRVVALIITDQPDDYSITTDNDLPIWKAVISTYHKHYMQSFIQEINQEIYPTALTVITLFDSLQGKLNENDIRLIESEFDNLQCELGLKYRSCQTEDDLQKVVDKEVVGMVLEKHRIRESLRQYEKTRTQRLARAQKVTRDAWRKGRS